MPSPSCVPHRASCIRRRTHSRNCKRTRQRGCASASVTRQTPHNFPSICPVVVDAAAGSTCLPESREWLGRRTRAQRLLTLPAPRSPLTAPRSPQKAKASRLTGLAELSARHARPAFLSVVLILNTKTQSVSPQSWLCILTCVFSPNPHCWLFVDHCCPLANDVWPL